MFGALLEVGPYSRRRASKAALGRASEIVAPKRCDRDAWRGAQSERADWLYDGASLVHCSRPRLGRLSITKFAASNGRRAHQERHPDEPDKPRKLTFHAIRMDNENIERTT